MRARERRSGSFSEITRPDLIIARASAYSVDSWARMDSRGRCCGEFMLCLAVAHRQFDIKLTDHRRNQKSIYRRPYTGDCQEKVTDDQHGCSNANEAQNQQHDCSSSFSCINPMTSKKAKEEPGRKGNAVALFFALYNIIPC